MARSIDQSSYHRVLRLSAVVVAVVLVFQSGLVHQSTKHLALETQNYLASVVGMSASVQPTELSLLTAQLAEREKALSEREAALNDREIAVDLQAGAIQPDTTTYLLAGVLFILLVLIVLNYTLDYLRSRERQGRTV